MYTMKNWYLDPYNDKFRCRGHCYGNPRFFSGEFVTTSYIVRIEVEDGEERLKLFTMSGSCYILDYADINESAVEQTEKALKSMGVALDLQRCLARSKERIEATKKKVAELIKPNELYVVMTGGLGIVKAYFKSAEDVIQMPVMVHTGTFQDSIYVSDYATGLCDWRIFPSFCDVTPYHWSDGLNAVHIDNVGENFVFKGSQKDILCESGKVTVIKHEDYVGEGLFSPDAVNGKCLLSDFDFDSNDKN